MTNIDNMKLITILRITAFLEGLSYLGILFVTMPLKYIYNDPEPNKNIGMLHGILFIAYIILVIEAKRSLQWNNSKTFKALLASIIPFGTFWADLKLFRS